MKKEEIQEYFLNPGELIFSKKPIIIKTVLGSCVAVTLYDKIHHFGGMCHYLLPESEKNEKSTKFGNVAIHLLISKFIQAGSDIKNLEATISGGAFIIFSDKEIFFVGDKNSDIATRILRKNNIRIRFINTGGDKGRKVYFNTLTNEIKVQTIEHIEVDDLYRD